MYTPICCQGAENQTEKVKHRDDFCKNMSELFQQQQQQQEELQRAAEEAARERSRERRRSSIGTLALPVGSDQQQNLNTSVNFGADEIEFEAQGVKINKDGLFIHDENVSEVHQDDLAVLTELGRGACSVVKKAQVCACVCMRVLRVTGVYRSFGDSTGFSPLVCPPG